jgi:SAM-dependent methyltransferase
MVSFIRGAAESLPFGSQSFDVVICRIALPYTDNRLTLGEIARVLRKEGVLLLKIHHARFYLDELKRSILSLNGLVALHDLRVLMAGLIYHVVGKQPRNFVFGGETFQTNWMLKRELKRRGLCITREMVGSDPVAPSYVISRVKGSVIE